MENYIVAVIVTPSGERQFHQFETEEELNYFLSIHDDYKLERLLK